MLPTLLALTLAAPAADVFARDNLVAWCVVPFDGKKRSPEDRAAMLKRLGFTRFAYDWRAEHLPTFDRELAALKANGIELTAVWFPAGLTKDAEVILDTLKKHKLRTQLWVMLTDPAPGKDQAAKLAAARAQVAPLARRALRQDCKVGLYNHGGWAGEPANLVALVGAVNLPNVGIVYNLHHGHDHLDRFPDHLRAMKPHLLCLNLNGMDKEGDKKGRKILPLGHGAEDLGLLKAIRDSGYSGPIGIIGHTDDDAEERLRDNLDGLDWLRPQLDGKPAGRRPLYRTADNHWGNVRLTPGPRAVIELSGRAPMDQFKAWPRGQVEWASLLRVTVFGGATPLSGEYRLTDRSAQFIPRFPLTPGTTYQVDYDPAFLPGLPDALPPSYTTTLTVPKPAVTPTAVVTSVYPTADTLPDNHLRFYVQFSAPMSRGDVYRHVRLLKADGTPVVGAFLELGEELWSADGTRFTLLFDPGRVKRDLTPRLTLGPVLEERKVYTLVVDAAWEDEAGAPLKAGFKKTFTAGPPDDAPVDPAKWAIEPTRNGVTVRFEKPLDHALAGRLIRVAGSETAGKVTTDGRSVTFPGPWTPGEYTLTVDTRLEDPCGNRVGRPFEVDVFNPVTKTLPTATVERRFVVK